MIKKKQKTKRCNKCKKDRNINDFYKSTWNKKTGKAYTCRFCALEYYTKNREKLQVYQRNYARTPKAKEAARRNRNNWIIRNLEINKREINDEGNKV